VLKGAMKGSEKSSLQGVFLEKDTIPEGSFAPLLTLKSPLVHKNFTARKIKALVMLPPDVHALSELFGVACLMQNGVIDKKPIILVGRDFWMPLMETLQKLMLTGSRKLVGEEDFSLFTLSDDPEEIIRLICRAGSESQSPLSPLE
jgi:predicted Rossmann-fold nucleotide-binding protein